MVPKPSERTSIDAPWSSTNCAFDRSKQLTREWSTVSSILLFKSSSGTKSGGGEPTMFRFSAFTRTSLQPSSSSTTLLPFAVQYPPHKPCCPFIASLDSPKSSTRRRHSEEDLSASTAIATIALVASLPTCPAPYCAQVIPARS